MTTAMDTLPKRVRDTVSRFGDRPAMFSKNSQDEYEAISYSQMWAMVESLTLAFQELGVRRGEHVGLMSDNRKEWLLTDLALLSLGAVDVPRGSDSTEQEMGYILAHADCSIAIAENRIQTDKILHQIKSIPTLKTIIVFDHEGARLNANQDLTLISFASVMERGEKLRKESAPGAFDGLIDDGNADELATILYTSGTTGEPKGVMLPHRSYTFQIDRVKNIMNLDEYDVFLSVLPVWHSFERAVEYIILGYAAAIAYSRPIGTVMLADMARIHPTWMTSVPRIWEGIRAAVYRNASKENTIKRALFRFFVGVGLAYAHMSNLSRGLVPDFKPRSRIADRFLSAIPLLVLLPFKMLGDMLVFRSLKERLGGRFVAGVSGGGALPPYVDGFFQAAGIKLLEGYGLTETGPVLAVRYETGPVPGTVGPLLPDIEYRVVADDGTEVGPNRKGVLYVRSPQMMLGYYKKPEETAQVLEDGWLNTGDLVVFTHSGPLRVLGRVKETIVLLGGENVEPTPIEDTLVQSDFIEQAMVVGQDKKFLGALIVPNFERLEEFAAQEGISYIERRDLAANARTQELIHAEIQSLVNHKKGFKTFEQIFRFTLLTDQFEVGVELTQTLKKKRDVIGERYRREIEALFR